LSQLTDKHIHQGKPPLPKISLGPKNFGNVINFGEYSHKDLLDYVTFSLQFVIPKPEVLLGVISAKISYD
jgi:hypothetical protein